jgi:antitoxin ParD1/3/4
LTSSDSPLKIGLGPIRLPGQEVAIMNVSLTPELERLVNDKVASGLYTSASEVIREALRLLKGQDEVRLLSVQELRRDIAAGLDQLDRGQLAALDMAAIKAKARKRVGWLALPAAE